MKKVFLQILFLSFLFSCKTNKPSEDVKQTFVLSDKMLETTTTDVARMQPVKNLISFFGKITADESKLIEVFPVVGGIVTKVNVELGDFVHKGQTLATIRSSEVAGFEKDLDDAKNDILIARNNLKIAQEMFESKLNSERNVIEAKSAVDKAQSQLSRAEATYRIYNIKPGAIFEVNSPLNGFVIQKNINQDMLLRNDRTNNIFDIAQIDEVWAVANINETDINKVKLGVDAAVSTLGYPDREFKGKVDKIFNIIDPDTKAMKVRIKLRNDSLLLKPEMRANIKISYKESVSMIAVPSTAIIFDKNKNFVMIYKDRYNIETRSVEVFRQVGNVSYISSGLKEGEKIMTSNQLLIYNELNN